MNQLIVYNFLKTACKSALFNKLYNGGKIKLINYDNYRITRTQ